MDMPAETHQRIGATAKQRSEFRSFYSAICDAKLQLLQRAERVAVSVPLRRVQFAALSVATEGAATGAVPGIGKMFPAASVS